MQKESCAPLVIVEKFYTSECAWVKTFENEAHIAQ